MKDHPSQVSVSRIGLVFLLTACSTVPPLPEWVNKPYAGIDKTRFYAVVGSGTAARSDLASAERLAELKVLDGFATSVSSRIQLRTEAHTRFKQDESGVSFEDRFRTLLRSQSDVALAKLQWTDQSHTWLGSNVTCHKRAIASQEALLQATLSIARSFTLARRLQLEELERQIHTRELSNMLSLAADLRKSGELARSADLCAAALGGNGTSESEATHARASALAERIRGSTRILVVEDEVLRGPAEGFVVVDLHLHWSGTTLPICYQGLEWSCGGAKTACHTDSVGRLTLPVKLGPEAKTGSYSAVLAMPECDLKWQVRYSINADTEAFGALLKIADALREQKQFPQALTVLREAETLVLDVPEHEKHCRRLIDDTEYEMNTSWLPTPTSDARERLRNWLSGWADPIQSVVADDIRCPGYMRKLMQELGLPWLVTHRASGMQMVLVPPGQFTMGVDGLADEFGPARQVRITRPFYIAVNELSAGEWNAAFPEQNFRTDNPHGVWFREYDAPTTLADWLSNRDVRREQRTSRYVVDAKIALFLQRMGLSLPTEAQWEYAARGSQNHRYAWGDEPRNFGREHMDRSTSCADRSWIGCNDMCGALGELCRDEFVAEYHDRLASLACDPFMPGRTTRSYRAGMYYHEGLKVSEAYCRAPLTRHNYGAIFSIRPVKELPN